MPFATFRNGRQLRHRWDPFLHCGHHRRFGVQRGIETAHRPGAQLNQGLIHMDVWENSFEVLSVEHQEQDCPACGKGWYEFL